MLNSIMNTYPIVIGDIEFMPMLSAPRPGAHTLAARPSNAKEMFVSCVTWKFALATALIVPHVCEQASEPAFVYVCVC